MASVRKFTKRLLVATNIFIVLIFLLVCANAFLPPDKWWIFSMLGFLFPLWLLLVFGFFVFWFFFYSRRISLISLFALILGWSNIHAFFAFNIPKKYSIEKSPDNLRILTWNIHYWDDFITKKAGASGHRAKMMEFVQQQNADLLCFQEFNQMHGGKEPENNILYIQNQLHYPYYFFSGDHKSKNGKYESGVIIFSRYPINDTIRTRYNSDANRGSESLIGVDISVNAKTIRIYTTHLQSVLFRSKDFRDVEIIRNVEDSMLEASKSIIKKLRRAFGLRENQADIVREELDKSPNPVIICGDFNDVPNSYTYFHIRGSRQDAFMEKGAGIGRTYVNLSPTLRIDYIMADKGFKVLQCHKFALPYSDHHPIIADFQLP